MDFDVQEYAMEVTWTSPTDIVITDPCYLFQEESDQLWHDVLRAVDNNTPCRLSPSNHDSDRLVEAIWDEYTEHPGLGDEDLKKIGMRAHIAMEAMKLSGHGMNNIRWAPAHPKALSPFGISKCLCGNTMYGDWGCLVIDDNEHRKIGEFTADAGMYIVCALDETPQSFREWIKIKSYCAAIIPKFSGTIGCEPICNCFNWSGNSSWMVDYRIVLVGSGSVDFHTCQTE
jgi:hypothetical protein